MRWWLVIMLIPAAGLIGQAPETTESEYVGEEACQPCHSEIDRTYQKVGMARTFDRIEAAPVVEDWSGDNRLYHKPSDQYFEMTRRGGRFYQRRYQLDRTGNEFNNLEREIHWVIGSANKERDYVHRSESGELVQLPVGWYTAEGRWGMAPGYDRPDHKGFSRRINYRCFFCHNAYPRLPAGQARYEAQLVIFPDDLPRGIDCERCHGPGTRHIERALASAPPEGIRASIVNPARLSRKLQLDVCQQCHLEPTSAPLPNFVLKVGRGIFSFRPGDDLEDYGVYFDFPAGSGHEDDFNIVHQAYRLRRSLCFRESDMTCTSCHDPHRTSDDKTAFYNQKCATCHESGHCTESTTVRAVNGNNCVACHMPQRRTNDVVHIVMTDHYIQRQPPDGLLEPLAEPHYDAYRGELSFYLPEPDQDLYLGLALARGANIERGIELLENVVGRDKAAAAEPYYDLAAGYNAANRLDQAAENYARVLEIDPAYAEARYSLGIVRLKQGRIEEAIRSLDEAIERLPTLADAHVALGVAWLRSGDVDRARRHNLDALRFDPLHEAAYMNLALLELQLDRPRQAAIYFQEVLRIEPHNRLASQSLERIRSEGR